MFCIQRTPRVQQRHHYSPGRCVFLHVVYLKSVLDHHRRTEQSLTSETRQGRCLGTGEREAERDQSERHPPERRHVN